MLQIESMEKSWKSESENGLIEGWGLEGAGAVILKREVCVHETFPTISVQYNVRRDMSNERLLLSHVLQLPFYFRKSKANRLSSLEVVSGMSSASVAGAKVRSEAKSETKERSFRSVSMGSWEGQLPIEEPISLADTLALHEASVISQKGEDLKRVGKLQSHNSYIPEEGDDWPIRMDLKPLPRRPKHLPLEPCHEDKQCVDYKLRNGFHEPRRGTYELQ